MKDTHKQILLSVTGMNEIPAISEGIESSANGFIISEDGLTRMAEALEGTDANAAAVTELQSQLEIKNGFAQELTDALSAANETISGNNARIQELEARVAELENENPITVTSRNKDKSSKTNVAFHNDPNVSFNAMADRLMGKPAEKEIE